MIRFRPHPSCVVLALFAAAASACARQPESASPSSSPATTASAAAASSAVSPSPVPTPVTAPVNFHGERVGSHYVYATKQKGARTVYALRADSVNAVYNGALTGLSTFTNPHVVFYGNAGKRLVADAPAGTVVEKDKSVVMTGGARAKTQDGMTLESDTLRYEDESQIVHGVGHVVVGFPTGEQMRGNTVDWNLRDGHINVGA